MSRRRNGRSTSARAKYNGSDGTSSKSFSMRKALRAKRRPDLFRTISRRPKTLAILDSVGSNTFKVPDGVDTVSIKMWGGGGGGGQAQFNSKSGVTNLGTGGGGGACIQLELTDLKPGTVLTFGVGGGGAAGTTEGTQGTNGGNSTFTFEGITYTAGGGYGGRAGGLGLYFNSGQGGIAQRSGGSLGTLTNGTSSTNMNIAAGTNTISAVTSGGIGFFLSGGVGSNNGSSQNNAAGANGRVEIS